MSRRALVALLVISTAGALPAFGCTCATPGPGPALSAQVPAASTAPPGPADAGPGDASSPASPPSPVQAEAQPAMPPRTMAPGSTRGTIACGERRCDAAREKCVSRSGPAWACVPRDAEEKDFNDIYECDDGTDCPPGKTCCMSFASAAVGYVCTTRREGDDCRVEVCEPGGARCPAGQSCSGGFCAPDKVPGPRCGERSCTGARPLCVWEKGKGRCASGEEVGEAAKARDQGATVAILRCTQSSDCGAGMTCCTGMALGATESFCSLNCDLANSMKYCSSDADCPTVAAIRLRCRKPEIDLPPWSRLCQAPP